MAKKKVVKASKAVPKGGRLAGHIHEYEAHPMAGGAEHRVCIAGGGCTHAYTWRPGDREP